MSPSKLEALQSEVGTLEGFIRELTDDDFIERMQLEQRLDAVRERLNLVEAQPQPKRLPITFRGGPVDGTRSIDASFATQALHAFIEATATVTASLISGELKTRGRLPGVHERALRIVDTAVGSFGFELELPPADDTTQMPLLPQDDPYAEAITQTMSLLDQAATEDDDAISELIADIHPRAAAKVQAFAKVLADHKATFAAEFDGKHVRFIDETCAARAVEALKDEDISEDHKDLQGTLVGVLPRSRAFEVLLADGRPIRGKIERALEEDISDFKQRWENVEATLSFRIVRVRERRRYILSGATALT